MVPADVVDRIVRHEFRRRPSAQDLKKNRDLVGASIVTSCQYLSGSTTTADVHGQERRIVYGKDPVVERDVKDNTLVRATRLRSTRSRRVREWNQVLLVEKFMSCAGRIRLDRGCAGIAQDRTVATVCGTGVDVVAYSADPVVRHGLVRRHLRLWYQRGL